MRSRIGFFLGGIIEFKEYIGMMWLNVEKSRWDEIVAMCWGLQQHRKSAEWRNNIANIDYLIGSSFGVT